jgi:hypothetical protein
MTPNTTKDTEDKRDRNLLKATCECGHGIRSSRRVLEVAKPKCSVCHKRFVATVVAGLAIVTTALAVTATGAGASSVRPITAQQIAAKLVPLGCTATPDTSTATFGIKAKVELSCTINGENVSIDQYRNAAQIASNLTMVRSAFGCSMLKSFGLGSPSFVTDGLTTTAAQTQSTTAQIRHLLGHGATVTTVHCK